jgi:hypothetical protein
MVHQANGTMVRRFAMVHSAPFHLIIVREGLGEFDHVHPEIDEDGMLSVEYRFPTGGQYILFGDFKPESGPPTIARAKIEVAGKQPAETPLVVNTPGEVIANGIHAQVTIDATSSGQEQSIGLLLTDDTGKAVTDLEPYMGAMGHLVIISADGESFIHAHPSGISAIPGEVRFEAHITNHGRFKAWAQFQRNGQVQIVPFVFET